MNAQIRLNLDTGATEIFTGDKWVATYVQEDIDKLQAEIDALREEREGLCVFCENRTLSKKAEEK
jgi:hypothetical protein